MMHRFAARGGKTRQFAAGVVTKPTLAVTEVEEETRQRERPPFGWSTPVAASLTVSCPRLAKSALPGRQLSLNKAFPAKWMPVR